MIAGCYGRIFIGLTLLLLSWRGVAQEAEDPLVRWMYEYTMPRGGPGEVGKYLGSYAAEATEPERFRRLVQVATIYRGRALNPEDPYRQPVRAALRILGATGRDDVIDVIGAYISHPTPDMNAVAVDSLRNTKNPKAIPYLALALSQIEARLPMVLNDDPAVSERFERMVAPIQALSAFGEAEASVALDASVARLREKYGSSKQGETLLAEVQRLRDKGRRERERSLSPSGAPPKHPLKGVRSSPVKSRVVASRQSGATSVLPPKSSDSSIEPARLGVVVAVILLVVLLLWARRFKADSSKP